MSLPLYHSSPWHLLADDQATFTDLGPGHYDTHAGTQRAIRNHIRGLHALGYQVTPPPRRITPTHVPAPLRSAGNCRLPTHHSFSD